MNSKPGHFLQLKTFLLRVVWLASSSPRLFLDDLSNIDCKREVSWFVFSD